jgi:hypothetical protein
MDVVLKEVNTHKQSGEVKVALLQRFTLLLMGLGTLSE